MTFTSDDLRRLAALITPRERLFTDADVRPEDYDMLTALAEGQQPTNRLSFGGIAIHVNPALPPDMALLVNRPGAAAARTFEEASKCYAMVRLRASGSSGPSPTRDTPSTYPRPADDEGGA